METFRLVLLEEARDFLRSLPAQVYKKILYNVDRIAGGERNSKLFKKLGKTPKKEIDKAEEIMKRYFELKKHRTWNR